MAEAAAGQADPTSVKLLIHALRGGEGEARLVRFGHARHGHAPMVNRHSSIAAMAHSRV